MYAVEFQAMIQNGTIQVPYQYQQRFKKPVRVILLTEQEEESAPTNYIEELMKHPLHIPDFEPLSREEIYDRD